MKGTYYYLFALLFGNIAIGQGLNPYDQFNLEIKKQSKDKEKTFNVQTLNVLFANKVGTAFGGTNDLSLQKYFTTLDVKDNSLALGVNYDSRGSDETKKLSFIFSGALKVKAKNEFATFYKNGDFQENNIGTSLKVSFIGNGYINFNEEHKLKICKHRDYLKNVYDGKANELNSKLKTYSYMTDDERKSYIKSKNDELFIELVKDEVAYVEKNRLYHHLSDYWLSLEVYAPFGENRYNVTEDVTKMLQEKTFYAFSSTLSGNYVFSYSSGRSIFLKGQYSLKNNNNILIDDLKSIPFQSTISGNNNMIVVTDVNDGYITDFKQFLTHTITLEPAIFILNNTVGFSPSIEFNLGEYRKTNWKLGIPLSFKDKDNKPKINFEIQWKEINTFQTNVHLVGFSANYQFGDLIN